MVTSTIAEKRVYADREAALDAYVASPVGVVRVRINDDAVGEFALVERCDARDVGAGGGSLAVATAEDVLVPSHPDESDGAFVGTAFGPAVAVGVEDGGDGGGDGTLLAADADGVVARRREGTWEELASLDAPVRAIDGDFVGADGGAYRVRERELDHAGLTDVRDVSTAGVPLAATADGLYRLGNGWMRVLDRPVDVVAADPRTEPGSLARAHAAAGTTLYERDGDGWRVLTETERPVAGIAYGEAERVYAVTEAGTFLAAGDDGLRSRSIGVDDVTGLAIPLDA